MQGHKATSQCHTFCVHTVILPDCLYLKCYESVFQWFYPKFVSGSVQVLIQVDKSGQMGFFQKSLAQIINFFLFTVPMKDWKVKLVLTKDRLYRNCRSKKCKWCKAAAETLSPHCGVLVEWTKGNKAFACLSSSKS